MPNAPLIGKAIAEIPTPALVADLDRLEANLKTLASYFAARPAKLRPHFKSHKCVELARRQLAAGNASGITCAKLSEAEALVRGGIRDVLIANQVVGPAKAARLALLNRGAVVRSAVDSSHNLRELGQAARQAGVTVPVLIEVDVGMRRCGVLPGGPAIELAREAIRTEGLRFDGLQGYEGHVVTHADYAERTARTQEALRPLIETRRALESAGIAVPIVSSGGTGTYDITGNLAGIDEVQCGSYALMDWAYARIRPEFAVARWILATVISATADYAVVDVGLKGVGSDFGPARVEGHPEAQARYTAEEHIPFDGLRARVGDSVRLVPSHGCTTQNLHRRMFAARKGVIEDIWAIEGSGCLE